jgi:pimeloyl-ACP methyl ester carboxylesterase
LSVIDNCGHSPQMEKPDEFNSAVGAFLNSLG